MSSRDAILASVRANLPKATSPLPKPALFDQSPPTSLVETFKNSLTRMGGRIVEPGPAEDPLAPVRALIEQSRLGCSATTEVASELDLAAIVEPRDLADVDHAVVRAVFGVAETGSVLLTDETLKVSAVAYLAQHLVVLLDPSDIVANLHNAYARPELGERCYTVFHSGPSATADIEGVLILGAQGVRSLSIVLAPRPPEPPEVPSRGVEIPLEARLIESGYSYETTTLAPFLRAFDEKSRKTFLERYASELGRAYSAQADES